MEWLKPDTALAVGVYVLVIVAAVRILGSDKRDEATRTIINLAGYLASKTATRTDDQVVDLLRQLLQQTGPAPVPPTPPAGGAAGGSNAPSGGSPRG